MSKIYSLLGVDAPFDPFHRFETSWLLSPRLLFWYRALVSLYAFTVNLITLGWIGEGGGRQFSYFTVLTYWGIAFYFLFAALHTLSLVTMSMPFLNRWPRPLQALHGFFYTTIVTYPFLVTVVYWVLLFNGKGFSSTYGAWSSISQHALNALFALLEILLPRTAPPPWLHIPPLIVLLALYVALVYVTRAAQGFYVYDFLDSSAHGHGRVAIYIFGILGAMLVIFVVVRTLIGVRQRWTERRLGVASDLETVDNSVNRSPDLEKQAPRPS